MSSSYKYQVLFEVRILHHYLLDEASSHFEGMNQSSRNTVLRNYPVEDLFDIIPTTKSMGVLKNNQLLFKKTNTGFIVLTRVDNQVSGEAFIDLRSSDKLSFYIKPNNLFLLNFSSLTLNSGLSDIYYFHNRNKDSFLYPSLTSLAPVFDATSASEASSDGDPETFAYYPGDILTDSDTTPTEVYEAIKSTNNNITTASDWRKDIPAEEYDNSATYQVGDVIRYTDSGVEGLYQAKNETTGNVPTDTSNWDKLKNLPLHYVTKSDLIEVYSRLFNYTLSSSGITISVEVEDINSNLLISKEFTSTDENLTYQIDMRHLSEGMYTLKITDTSGPSTLIDKKIFLMEENSTPSDKFGIIEIFLGSDQGQYSIVDAANLIQSNEFEVRIKNRSTVWRYINSSDLVVHESSFNPLTKKGFITEQLDGEDLPNPDIQIIKPEPDQYYSEIHLNTTT